MKKIIAATVFFCLPWLVVVSTAQEEEIYNPVKLVWDANTETDLAGYRVYEAAVSGQYDFVNAGYIIQIPAGTEEWVFPARVDGKLFWVLTAYDFAGNESGPSNEVTASFDSGPPAPPTGCSTQ